MIVTAATFKFLIPMILFSMNALASQSQWSNEIIKLVRGRDQVSIDLNKFQITAFDTETETKKLSRAVFNADQKCLGKVKVGVQLAADLARVVETPKIIPVLSEIYAHGALINIMTNDRKNNAGCGVRMFSIYLLTGEIVTLSVRTKLD